MNYIKIKFNKSKVYDFEVVNVDYPIVPDSVLETIITEVEDVPKNAILAVFNEEAYKVPNLLFKIPSYESYKETAYSSANSETMVFQDRINLSGYIIREEDSRETFNNLLSVFNLGNISYEELGDVSKYLTIEIMVSHLVSLNLLTVSGMLIPKRIDNTTLLALKLINEDPKRFVNGKVANSFGRSALKEFGEEDFNRFTLSNSQLLVYQDDIRKLLDEINLQYNVEANNKHLLKLFFKIKSAGYVYFSPYSAYANNELYKKYFADAEDLEATLFQSSNSENEPLDNIMNGILDRYEITKEELSGNIYINSYKRRVISNLVTSPIYKKIF